MPYANRKARGELEVLRHRQEVVTQRQCLTEATKILNCMGLAANMLLYDPSDQEDTCSWWGRACGLRPGMLMRLKYIELLETMPCQSNYAIQPSPTSQQTNHFKGHFVQAIRRILIYRAEGLEW